MTTTRRIIRMGDPLIICTENGRMVGEEESRGYKCGQGVPVGLFVDEDDNMCS